MQSTTKLPQLDSNHIPVPLENNKFYILSSKGRLPFEEAALLLTTSFRKPEFIPRLSRDKPGEPTSKELAGLTIRVQKLETAFASHCKQVQNQIAEINKSQAKTQIKLKEFKKMAKNELKWLKELVLGEIKNNSEKYKMVELKLEKLEKTVESSEEKGARDQIIEGVEGIIGEIPVVGTVYNIEKGIINILSGIERLL